MKQKRNVRKKERNISQTMFVQAKEFTILEFLVVISIFIILVSLLLPALQKARKTGMQIKCTGNLKQIASCLNMYTMDYDDYCPPYRENPAAGSSSDGQYHIVYWKYGNITEKNSRQSIGYCPGAKKGYAAGTYPNATGFYPKPGSLILQNRTYAGNGKIFANFARRYPGTTLTPAPIKMAEIKRPSGTFTFVDGTSHTATQWDQYVEIRHVNRYNMSFADGHVKAEKSHFPEGYVSINAPGGYVLPTDTSKYPWNQTW